MKLRYLYSWFVLLLVAIINGGLRDLTYGKHVSELLAHQISCVVGIALLALVISQFVRRWPPTAAREAWFIGVFWMVLTVAFELLFFHYVAGRSWEELLANYDMASGRLWPLILFWVLVAPYFSIVCGADLHYASMATDFWVIVDFMINKTTLKYIYPY